MSWYRMSDICPREQRYPREPPRKPLDHTQQDFRDMRYDPNKVNRMSRRRDHHELYQSHE
jgi:hypothetical protein